MCMMKNFRGSYMIVCISFETNEMSPDFVRTVGGLKASVQIDIGLASNSTLKKN